MKKVKKHLAMLLLIAVFLGTAVSHPIDAFADWVYAEEAILTPVVLTKITTQTDKVRVYVYPDTTLEIKDKTQTIFKKTYKSEGKKTIKIPLQKANTKLKFTLTTKYGVVDTVTKTVKDDGVISKKKINASLKKPKIAGKVTDKTTSVKVYAKKGETLYIQNGAKVLKKIKYKKTGYQAVGIPEQKAETKLTFYVADKKGRSAYVTKEVQDVTPPSKPKIQFTFEDFVDSADDIHYSSIDVDGEKGTDVYVKQNSKHVLGKWKYLGTLTEGNGYDLPFYLGGLPGIKKIYVGDTFSVRLVDDAGNKSKAVTTTVVKKEYTLY